MYLYNDMSVSILVLMDLSFLPVSEKQDMDAYVQVSILVLMDLSFLQL